MTVAQQLMRTLGMSSANDRRIMRAGRLARRRTAELASSAAETASANYVWIAVGVAAAMGVVLAQRGAIPGLSRRRRVRDVMVRHVLTIDSSATLREAAQRMREENVGMLPVVDSGRLRGILTDRDIVVRAVVRGGDVGLMRVEECATMDVACARPDWSVDEAMRLMSNRQIGRLPVLDRDDRVVGIVSLSSIALRSADEDDALDTARDVSRRSARSA
jgi:CBS domain-containing protein